VKFGGFDELYAPFLNESRTRGRFSVPRTGNPGISRFLRDVGNEAELDHSVVDTDPEFRGKNAKEISVRGGLQMLHKVT
jgi:hypothetical protein